MDSYILEGKTPVLCNDTVKWGKAFQKDIRQIGHTVIKTAALKDIRISTVFLGVDHNWSDKGDPILFETMVFGHPDEDTNEYQTRCCTYDQAVAMHKTACIWVLEQTT